MIKLLGKIQKLFSKQVITLESICLYFAGEKLDRIAITIKTHEQKFKVTIYDLEDKEDGYEISLTKNDVPLLDERIKVSFANIIEKVKEILDKINAKTN